MFSLPIPIVSTHQNDFLHKQDLTIVIFPLKTANTGGVSRVKFSILATFTCSTQCTSTQMCERAYVTQNS